MGKYHEFSKLQFLNPRLGYFGMFIYYCKLAILEVQNNSKDDLPIFNSRIGSTLFSDTKDCRYFLTSDDILILIIDMQVLEGKINGCRWLQGDQMRKRDD